MAAKTSANRSYRCIGNPINWTCRYVYIAETGPRAPVAALAQAATPALARCNQPTAVRCWISQPRSRASLCGVVCKEVGIVRDVHGVSQVGFSSVVKSWTMVHSKVGAPWRAVQGSDWGSHERLRSGPQVTTPTGHRPARRRTICCWVEQPRRCSIALRRDDAHEYDRSNDLERGRSGSQAQTSSAPARA